MKKTVLFLGVLFSLLLSLAIAEETKIEGEGYDSAGEAVEAYIRALNDGNPREILKSFAIETYVDSFDRLLYTTKLQSFIPNTLETYPMPNDYMRNILVFRRAGEIIKTLSSQYIVYAWPNGYTEYSGVPEKLETESEAADFYEHFNNSPVNDWFGSIEFIEFISPERLGLSELLSKESHIKNIERRKQFYRCDAIEELCALVRIGGPGIDGKFYIQCMQCVCYDGKWYNNTQASMISNYMGLHSEFGGLFPYDDLK